MALAVGEAIVTETDATRWASDMRVQNTPRSRRPACMAGREFTSALYTGVAAGRVDDIRYFIRTERTA